jgi:hypothetical protein
MTFSVRSIFVASTVSALFATGAATGPASAAQTAPTAECVVATAQVAAARTDAEAARKTFVASTRPMGKLIAAERAAARTEVRTSTAALRRLERELRTTHDKSARKARQAQIRAERADLRHANRLLDSKVAVRAQVEAERKAAKTAFTAAKAALAAARVTAEGACGDTVEQG